MDNVIHFYDFVFDIFWYYFYYPSNILHNIIFGVVDLYTRLTKKFYSQNHSLEY